MITCYVIGITARRKIPQMSEGPLDMIWLETMSMALCLLCKGFFLHLFLMAERKPRLFNAMNQWRRGRIVSFQLFFLKS